MIMILPFLLMTLHFSQIGFTDDLTFMINLLYFLHDSTAAAGFRRIPPVISKKDRYLV